MQFVHLAPWGLSTPPWLVSDLPVFPVVKKIIQYLPSEKRKKKFYKFIDNFRNKINPLRNRVYKSIKNGIIKGILVSSEKREKRALVHAPPKIQKRGVF